MVMQKNTLYELFLHLSRIFLFISFVAMLLFAKLAKMYLIWSSVPMVVALNRREVYRRNLP